MDDRVSVDVVDGGHDALIEFLFGGNPDMAQRRTSELGEEALDKVEPGAVLEREGKFETAVRLDGEPIPGLLGDVSGVIVEDQLDGGVGGIGSVEQFEELDELTAAMAILDQGVNLTSEEIDPSQQTERAVALVFKVTREARMHAGLGVANPAPCSR